jgi:hypothetical protein
VAGFEFGEAVEAFGGGAGDAGGQGGDDLVFQRAMFFGASRSR